MIHSPDHSHSLPQRLIAPQALLFDMDGVLVDSEDLHWQTVGDVLRVHLGVQAPSLAPRIGWGDHELWEELRSRFQLKATAVELTSERNLCALKRLSGQPPPPMLKALEAIKSCFRNLNMILEDLVLRILLLPQPDIAF